MLAESESDAKGEVKVGDKVSGVIAKIDGETAFVDYGGRGEAIIRASELLGKDGEALFAVGDQIEAFAASVGDEVQLTRSVSRTDGNTDALYQAFKSGMPVEGQVDAVNKWGMGVIFQGGVRGFCRSRISTRPMSKAPRNTEVRRLASRLLSFAIRDAISSYRVGLCSKPNRTKKPRRSEPH